MLHLYRLMLAIVAVHGSDFGCEKRLDVVSEEEWPILQHFRREHLDKGHLISVGSTDIGTQAAVHTTDNTTIIYPDPTYKRKYGGNVMCEVLEIGGRAVTDIQYGNDFTVILTEDGFAWTAGLNLYGQLSRDTTDRALFTKVQGLPGVQQIATGLVHNVVLTNDHRLFSWGYGLDGRLGYNAGEVNPIPRRISGVTSPTFVCCSSLACMSLAGNSEVLTWGNPLYIGRSGYASPPAPVMGIPSEQTIIKVSCGAFHMVALSSSGRLYGWGSGNNGEILQADEFQTHVTELDLGEEVVRDVVAGPFITIITTDTEDAYYFGYYKGGAYKIPNLANSTHTPRDLMARSLSGQRTHGAVKLGCKANYV